jgi:outer membrane protein
MNELTIKKNFRKQTLIFCGLAMCVSANSYADDLLDIFNLAVENEPQIRQARALFDADHTRLDQSRALLLPSIALTANTSRSANGPSTTFSFADGYNRHSYGLSLNQNLFNMEAWYGFQSVKQSDMLAATNLALSEQQLILRVAVAYFDVLRSIDNLSAFRAEEAANERVLEQTTQRFEVGLIPITDVYDSQAAYDLARVNTLVEENNLSQRYEALEAITGSAHQDLDSLSEDFPIVSANPASMAEWVRLAQENNLSIRSAEYDFESKKQLAYSVRSKQLPTLSLSANYTDNSEVVPTTAISFINAASESSNIALSFSVPLFAGGSNRAQKRQAYYSRDASEEALEKAQRDSTQSTRNNYRSVETDVLAVAARAQAIISAQSALEATEVGAEVGTRNVVDVVLAQRTLFQAQRNYADARYTYVINTLNLKGAAGILSPQDIIELNESLE